MKKTIIVLLVLCMLILGASGADMLYSMLNGDNEYFSDAQDAIVIGQFISSDTSDLKVKTVHVIYSKDGYDVEDEFYIDSDITYVNLPETYPETGEYAFLPIKYAEKSEARYDLSYNYMCRADMGDYENLKLYFDSDNPLCMDVKAIEYFINSNGKIKNFAFDGDTLIVAENDETVIEKITVSGEYLPLSSGGEVVPFVPDTTTTSAPAIMPAPVTKAPDQDKKEDGQDSGSPDDIIENLDELIPEPDNRVDKIVPLPIIIGAAAVFVACLVAYAVGKSRNK